MGRKRRACARAGRVSAVVALAAAALFARERLGTHGAVSPGSSEVGARRSTSASAGLASRVPTPAVADASDADEAVVSSPAADEAVVSSPTADEVATRAGARVARLSAADAARRYGFARNASITATFATIEVADMLRNWIEHAVFVARLPNVAVIALDEATLSKCANGDLFFSRADETNDARVAHVSLTCLDASRAFEDADALRVDAASRDSPLIGYRENKKVFNQIGIVKTRVIHALLNANLHVLMSDVDVVWLRDPSEYFRSGQARRAHVAVSSDCVFGFEPGRPATDAFGQKPSPNNAEFNTGVLLLRPAKATMALVERWTASQLALMENHDMNDQTHFNKAVNDFGGREELGAYAAYAWDDDADAELATIVFPPGGENNRQQSLTPDHALFPNEHERGLRPRYYRTRADPNAAATSTGDASGVARVALLPTGLFSNGHTFFVSRVAERSGVSPFAVHNTYQYSGTAGKIARFRENGLWAVDDAAYFGVTSEDERFDSHDDEQFGDAKRRFLLLTYDVPGALADPAPSVSTPKGGTPVTHVDLIRYQVNRVRDGLALASVLNRTLILPPLLSTCDRWFNLLPNCTQGDARFPMAAPLDHVFLVFALDAFGGGGRYVEHGFLTNRAQFLTRRAEKKRRVGENGDATRGGDDDRPSPGLGPVARLEFRNSDDASRASHGSRGSHGTDEALRSASRRENDKSFRVPFRVPDDFVSVPGYVPALDPATARAVAATKRGSPRHFSAAFGSVASEVVATLGVGGVGLEAARLLVVENVRPGAFAGFGDADENAAFHERMTPLAHEWCCRENGTVPHLPTPYGEEERYAYARE